MKTIAIAGAGVAGLAAASLLAKQGFEVTLFERFDVAKPLGSGLVLQPASKPALRELGIFPAVQKFAAPIKQLYGETSDGGRKVLDVRYKPELPGYSIQRACLHHLLYEQAVSAGAKLELGCDIGTLEKGAVYDAKGQRLGRFDLVIEARGAATLAKRLNRKPLEFGALWLNVPNNSVDPIEDRLEQRYLKARKMLGIMPMRTHREDPEEKVALFYSLRGADYERWSIDGIDAWRDELAKIWPRFANMLPAGLSEDDITFARYYHGHLGYLENGVVRLGDSAHAASPQLGQGANMALLDALALSRALHRFDGDEALKRFSKARRNHMLFYQLASYALTPFYQSDRDVLPWIRDHILTKFAFYWPADRILRALATGEALPSIGRSLR